MLGFLNNGKDVLGEAWLGKIHGLGFAGVRVEILPHWKPLVDELGTYQKLSPIFLFGGGDMSGWDANDIETSTTLVAKHITENSYFAETTVYFEIGNAPDVAVPAWRERTFGLSNTYWECYRAVKSINNNIELITGGISNLTVYSLNWLEEFLADPLIPAKAIIGFRRQAENPDLQKPHSGFETRDNEMNRLQALAGGKRLFCTETGLSQGPYRVGLGFPLCWVDREVYISPEEQAEALKHEWNFYARRGVVGMVWQQPIYTPTQEAAKKLVMV